MMKYILLILLLATAAHAQSTETFGTYVNGLPTATAPGATDQVYIRQGGVSKQIPFSGITSLSTIVNGTTVIVGGSPGQCLISSGATGSTVLGQTPCSSGGGGGFNQSTPYNATGANTARTLADVTNDHGLNIKNFGAIGDGSSHKLSSIYANLAAAQAVYPFVSDLTQEVDWAATESAIAYSYANGNQNVYCPAVPSSTAAYILSNPVQLQNPTTGSGASAWASGTTYNTNATVLYNGLQFTSLGAGNKNNPPTTVSGYPANLAIAGGSLPYANVTVSGSGTATVTLTGHGFSAGQPLIFLKQTYTDKTYASPALPTGISANTVYYVLAAGLTANSFEISATAGGTPVTTSDSGSGVITISTQVWAWQAVGNSDFGGRVSFTGDDGRGDGGDNNGCMFAFDSFVAPAIVVGGYNGNLLKQIRVNGPGQIDFGYRCQIPSASVGIGNISDGAGTHDTTFDKDYANGFNVGWQSNLGPSGTLGDSNTFLNGNYSNNCTGLLVNSQENFINNAFDVTINNNTTAISSTLGAGLRVFGGNDSTPSALSNSFAISSVAAQNVSNVYLMQATLTGDGTLNNAMCGYNKQCGYTAFSVVTTHYGVIPLSIDGYNPATGVINLHVNGDWTNPYQNTCCTGLVTDLTATTKLYANEAVTTYKGSDLTIIGTHVENSTVTTTLLNSFTSFGSPGPAHLSDVLLDYVASLNQFSVPSDSVLGPFYAQNNIPFISGDVLVDNLYGGYNLENNSFDRVLLEGSGYQEFRHTQAANTNSPQTGANTNGPGLLWNQRFASNNTFTGSNAGYTGIFGSGGLGGGKWDNGAAWISGANTTPDQWRSKQWGASDFYGVKPAPYAVPCVTPAQVTTSLSAPAITFTSSLTGISVNATGTSYANNDIVSLVNGTHTVTAQVKVTSVSGSGGIQNFSLQTQGTYTAEPATFSSFGGSGSGATWQNPTWWVFYNVPYPMLWGGTQYNVCDYKGGSQTKYGIQSTNLGYSYFTNLTTSNVPNLSWSSLDSSPVVYMNQEALELMFPGLVIGLTGSNGGACPDTQETFMVTEVHPYLGYITVINAGQDGSPYLPQWGGNNGTTICTGTTIAQTATNSVFPY